MRFQNMPAYAIHNMHYEVSNLFSKVKYVEAFSVRLFVITLHRPTKKSAPRFLEADLIILFSRYCYSHSIVAEGLGDIS